MIVKALDGIDLARCIWTKIANGFLHWVGIAFCDCVSMQATQLQDDQNVEVCVENIVDLDSGEENTDNERRMLEELRDCMSLYTRCILQTHSKWRGFVLYSAIELFLKALPHAMVCCPLQDQLQDRVLPLQIRVLMVASMTAVAKFEVDEWDESAGMLMMQGMIMPHEDCVLNRNIISSYIDELEVYLAYKHDLMKVCEGNKLRESLRRLCDMLERGKIRRRCYEACTVLSFYIAYHGLYDTTVDTLKGIDEETAVSVIVASTLASAVASGYHDAVSLNWATPVVFSKSASLLSRIVSMGERARTRVGDPFSVKGSWEGNATRPELIEIAASLCVDIRASVDRK